PQATLMKMIVEGVMNGNLPWALVFTGVFIAVVAELVGIPVLPFAIGIYLPVQLNACIMVGGIVRLFFDKMKKEENEKKGIINDGILFCSGMIAGEGLVGILLAVLAVFGFAEVIDLSGVLGLPAPVANLASLGVFALIILSLLKFTIWKKRKNK
ncbi:MAG: OPT/YSL family transporter, partial [Clostridia bacterium]|nr:OPT/YSL family transporter [Clostridia bacterium]